MASTPSFDQDKHAFRISPGLVSLIVPVLNIYPDPANLNKHNDESLKAIRESLLKYGQRKPIVISTTGKIIAGNGTYAAALQLHGHWIAAERATDLTADELTEYSAVDNQTSNLSAFDRERLSNYAAKLLEQMPGHTLPGWSQEEFKKLSEWSVNKLNGANVEASAHTAPKAAVDKSLTEKPANSGASAEPVLSGDIWRLGEHTLTVGSGDLKWVKQAITAWNALGADQAELFYRVGS